MSKADNKKYCIFLSAAEASGDRLCAKLITILKQSDYNIKFVGLGGEKMAAAGCDLLEDTTKKAAMIYKALAEIAFFIRVIKKAKNYLKNNKVDLVIVCDSPSFNFHIARAASAAGTKTLFYVAPQLWAWGKWRIKKLKRLCTAGLAVILPFEPDWFGQQGLDCQFVGNPLLEDTNPKNIKPKDYHNFSIASAHIALMPGSRKAEIKSLWPAMQQIARTLKARHPSIKFTAVAANETALQTLKKHELKIIRCDYTTDTVFQTASEADLTLVASGSATLQVASAACPMVVMYQSNKFLWHIIGKWLVTTKHLSLVNILAEEELVPEFMPYFSSTAPITEVCEKLLNNKEALTALSRRLTTLTKPLAQTKASENVVQMVIKQLNS